MKDVSYSELESLIQYIYTGKVLLPEGLKLANFTQLAKSIGISGEYLLSLLNENDVPFLLHEDIIWIT